MIKFLLLSIFYFTGSSSNLFYEYKQMFNKTYTSKYEENYRYQIFQKNMVLINKHNSLQNNFNFTMNKFTDLDYYEFKNEIINENNLYNEPIKSECQVMKPTYKNLPKSIDWVEKGKVTSVKNQGNCGSCWAFSTVGAIESALAIKKNKLIDLSEQQLMDCSKDYDNDSCNGGLMDNAFEYLIDNKRGLCSSAEYPYLDKDENVCKSCNKTYGEIKSCIDVPSGDNLALKEAVFKTPVSIAIDADSVVFQFYDKGVITSNVCGTTLNHGVLLVGYGTENGMDYWKIKNSWGDNWGDNGYVKIERSNKTNDVGTCGVSSTPSYPVLF